jgi:hypothetical protein
MAATAAGPVSVEPKLDRLTRLVGTDEGFYILALHAFVEYFLRYEKGYGEGPTFPELTWIFREQLLADRGEELIEGLPCLARLGHQHVLTNRVRHAFEPMDPEEAAATTHLFVSFCRLAGLDKATQVRLLERSLSLWNERTSVVEAASVMRRMQEEIRRLQDRTKDLLEQRREYEGLKAGLEEYQQRLAGTEREIRRQREAERQKSERLDELRRERNALIQERDGLLERLARYRELETYLQYLGRLSLYTRTRLDYEQSISQLTPEQEQVVGSISPKRSFLIQGGAGTGKSLVLIECLRRALLQGELSFAENESVVLVTFTRTLAKYDRYIVELKGLKLPLEVISTVDGLFFQKLQAVAPGVRYDFELLASYFTAERTPSFLSPEELISEIENFLFGCGLSEQEYLGESVPRAGMPRRLSREERAAVWDIRQGFVGHMEAERAFTKNYGQLRLYEYLKAHREDRRLRDIRCLFLDEVQDLTPVALGVLRELTLGAMVMAGDVSQSIYSARWPFARTDIRLRGKTRVLRTNFRNTIQVYDLAEKFRRRSTAVGAGPGEGSAGEPGSAAAAGAARAATRPFAFREGPVPELYVGRDEAELQRLLAAKIEVFVEELGYEPENLCILVPRNVEIPKLGACLERGGLLTADVAAEEFSFRTAGRIRISTLHSSKGLDFPVVLLYLPYLPWRGQYDRAQTERLLRNLVYVGITRAMDNVNVFLAESDDPILRDLAACFRE